MSGAEVPAKEVLWARYGPGVRLADDAEFVLVFQHQSQEAAEAYALGNREHHGHPSRAELRESVGWVSVVDLRPAVEAAEAEFRAQFT